MDCHAAARLAMTTWKNTIALEAEAMQLNAILSCETNPHSALQANPHFVIASEARRSMVAVI
jgi:hypothetical protein